MYRAIAIQDDRRAANQNDRNLYRSTRQALPGEPHSGWAARDASRQPAALPDNRLQNGQLLNTLRGILRLERGRP
jgi:hypothetical protein